MTLQQALTALQTAPGGEFDCTDVKQGEIKQGNGTVDCTSTNLNYPKCTVAAEVDFPSPGPVTVYIYGTALADFSAQSGNWGSDPDPNTMPPLNTYVAARAIATHSNGSTPVTVQTTVPTDSGDERTITVTFTEVDADGETAIISDSSAEGTLPDQFRLLGQYFHVMPTLALSYKVPIEVCASFTEDPLNPEHEKTTGVLKKDLKIYHYEAASHDFEDRTDSVDTINNIICAKVDNLSEFALVAPITSPSSTPRPVGGVAELPDEPSPATSSHNSSAPNAFAVAGLATGAILLLTAGGWYARRRWDTR